MQSKPERSKREGGGGEKRKETFMGHYTVAEPFPGHSKQYLTFDYWMLIERKCNPCLFTCHRAGA